MPRAIDVLVADHETAVANDAIAVLQDRFAFAPPVYHRDAIEAALAEHRPRLLMLGLIWPGGTGLDHIREWATRFSPLKVVVRSSRFFPSVIYHVMAAGADGTIVTPVAPEGLLEGVAAVLSGAHYNSPELREAPMLGPFHYAPPDPREAPPPDSGEYRYCVQWISQYLDLTARQAEASFALRLGLSEKQIAVRMKCSRATVHSHLENARKRLKVFEVTNAATLSGKIAMTLAAMPRGWGPLLP